MGSNCSLLAIDSIPFMMLKVILIQIRHEFSRGLCTCMRQAITCANVEQDLRHFSKLGIWGNVACDYNLTQLDISSGKCALSKLMSGYDHKQQNLICVYFTEVFSGWNCNHWFGQWLGAKFGDNKLTHCGLVMPYGDIDIGPWLLQAITLTMSTTQ